MYWTINEKSETRNSENPFTIFRKLSNRDKVKMLKKHCEQIPGIKKLKFVVASRLDYYNNNVEYYGILSRQTDCNIWYDGFARKILFHNEFRKYVCFGKFFTKSLNEDEKKELLQYMDLVEIFMNEDW